MPDWFTWPADLLLSIGGIVTSWFISKDASSFGGIQTMVSMLLLAVLVGCIAYRQSVADVFRLALRTSRKGHHHPPPAR